MEGSFEQLLMRAHFEEAKLRELRLITPQRGSTDTGSTTTSPATTNTANGMSRQPQQRGQVKRCFICNQQSHLAKQCPQQQRGRPMESQEQSQANRGNTIPITNCITPAKEGTLSVAKEKVTDLKKQLQTAELQETLPSKTATINGLCLLENECNPSLGPTISKEVILEDKPIKALVDTGSPVTIVFIDLLEILLNKHAVDQPPEDWCNEVTARIQSPSLTIWSYGGAEVNVIGHLTVSLALGDWRCQVAILVQKGATMDLLLGTDVLPLSEFCLLKRPYRDGPGIGMMQVEEMCRKQDEGSSETSQAAVSQRTQNSKHVMVVESPLNLIVKKTGMADMVSVIDNKIITVKLLTATQLPGRHARVVKAHVKESLEAWDLAFEPYKFHSEDKLVMTEKPLLNKTRRDA